jgi:hypothetical protein
VVAHHLKDLTVELENRPGTTASAAEALGKAGINIEGICGTEGSGKGTAHILVEDTAGARRALEGAGARVIGEREVVVAQIEDKPGSLGTLTRKIAAAGVNLNLMYLATNTRMVLGSNDMEKLRGALGEATASRR